MKQYIITEEEKTALLTYLAQQTFKDVWMGVEMLQKLPELPPVDTTKDDGETTG